MVNTTSPLVPYKRGAAWRRWVAADVVAAEEELTAWVRAAATPRPHVVIWENMPHWFKDLRRMDANFATLHYLRDLALLKQLEESWATTRAIA